MNLSSADQARGRELVTRYYPSLDDFRQKLFTRQLEECRNYYEWQDWCERLELTAKWYEDPASRPRMGSRRVSASLSEPRSKP